MICVLPFNISFKIFNTMKWLLLLIVCGYTLQIRLQLETLLAEKARLAHENSMFAGRIDS